MYNYSLTKVELSGSKVELSDRAITAYGSALPHPLRHSNAMYFYLSKTMTKNEQSSAKTITIKQIPFVYIIENMNVIEVKVDKIEVFSDYYRYVNEDKKVKINWWTLDQIDVDCFEENVNKNGHSNCMVFTTAEKAKCSKEFRRQMIAFYSEQKTVAEERLTALAAMDSLPPL